MPPEQQFTCRCRCKQSVTCQQKEKCSCLVWPWHALNLIFWYESRRNKNVGLLEGVAAHNLLGGI